MSLSAKNVILPFEVWQQKRDYEKHIQYLEMKYIQNPFSGIDLKYLTDFSNYCINKEPGVGRCSLTGLVEGLKKWHTLKMKENQKRWRSTPAGKKCISESAKRYRLKYPEKQKERNKRFAERWRLKPIEERREIQRRAYHKDIEKSRRKSRERTARRKAIKELHFILLNYEY